MKYKVYQIILSENIIEAVNAGEDDAKFNAYRKALLNADNVNEDLFEYYSHVANVEAESPAEVFDIMHHGYNSHIELIIDDYKSMSVGDLIIDENGDVVVVDGQGWFIRPIDVSMLLPELNAFVLQTSIDYDMKYDDVLYIYSNFESDEYYEKLEEFIKERRES